VMAGGATDSIAAADDASQACKPLQFQWNKCTKESRIHLSNSESV